MRGVMGNLLETDSDAASISESEKERTEGDGMESDILSVANKITASGNSNVGVRTDDPALRPGKDPDKRLDPLVESNEEACSSLSGRVLPYSSNNEPAVFNTLADCHSAKEDIPGSAAIESEISILSAISRTITTSPRELPPRSQLIQLKPTMCRPKLNSRNSTESSPDGINKQKNPKFIPYEPYKGAVRPMEGMDDRPRKQHSRTGSETSITSNSIDNSIQSLNLSDSNPDVQQCSIAQPCIENTHRKSASDQKSIEPTRNSGDIESRLKKQEQIIQKQTHALTLLKERLKIAEKDNHELHKENTRLKKMLVDSLSGDLFPEQDTSRTQHTINESMEALSDEIEVWRSKFLSSCVLVEQLTRENGVLQDTLGSATNILKDLKMSSTLSVDNYEVINAWLRSCRTSATNEPNSIQDS